jgi:hypothetical protein
LNVDAVRNILVIFLTLDGTSVGTDVNKTAPSNALTKLSTPGKPHVVLSVVATAVKTSPPLQLEFPNDVTEPRVIVITAVNDALVAYVWFKVESVFPSPQSIVNVIGSPESSKMGKDTYVGAALTLNVKDNVPLII